MPNIREYNSSESLQGIRPSEVGADALAQSGRRISGVYHEMGQQIGGAVAQVGGQIGEQVEQHMTMKEISTGAAAMANMVSAKNKKWSDLRNTTDLNDDTVGDKFLNEDFEPSVQQWMQGFTTPRAQEWALNEANRARDSMFHRVTADMSARSADAVITNLQTTLNSASSAAYSDPDSFQQSADLYRSAMEAAIQGHPNLTAEQTATLHEHMNAGLKEIAKASILGKIEANPAAAVKELQSSGAYDKYLSGPEQSELISHAGAYQRMLTEQARADENQQIKHNEEAAKSQAGMLTASMVQQDGTMVVPQNYYKDVAKIAIMPNAPEGLARSLIELGKSVANGPGTTDPHTYSDFAGRMLLPATDPRHLSLQEIFTARSTGNLSDKDMNYFKTVITDLPKDPQKTQALSRVNKQIEALKSTISKSTLLGADPEGDQRYGQFQQEAYNEFETAYQSGNWKDMLNPSSPFYLGKLAGRYVLDTKAATQEYMNNLQNGPTIVGAPKASVPQRNAGESPDDYLKRVGQ